MHGRHQGRQQRAARPCRSYVSTDCADVSEVTQHSFRALNCRFLRCLNGPSYRKTQMEKVGGEAPHLFQWFLRYEGAL